MSYNSDNGMNQKKSKISKETLLQYVINEGIIDVTYVQEQIEMKKRDEILQQHPYSIWQGTNDKKWYTYLPDETKPKGIALKKRTSQKAIENLVIEYWQNQEEYREYTFNDVYFMWRQVQDQLVEDNSVAKYESDYNRFFLDSEFAQQNIKDITEDTIKIFMCKTIKRLELGKETARKLYGYVNNTIKCARKNQLIDGNPTEFLESKQFYRYCVEKFKPVSKKVILDDDMKALRERFRQDHEKHPNYIPTYAVELASLTGMRVGELSALRWEYITDKYIIIDESEKSNRKKNEFYVSKTKNKMTRFFPLTDEIRDLLERVRAVEEEYGYLCEWVFANENGRIHAKTISSCSQTKCRQLKIDAKGIHAYRKTINSKMRCNGVSSTVAASILGHTKEVNEQYYTFDITSMEERAKIVSDVNKQTCAV